MLQSETVRKYDTYKDSGIEWIGKIPQEWNAIKFKYCFSIIGGNGFSETLQGNSNGEIPFCKCSDINDSSTNFVSSANNYVSVECCNDNNFNLVPENSILIAKIGEALKKNHRKINTVPCCIDNNMEAFVLKNNVDKLYYFYVLKCIDMLWFDNGGTIPSVNNEKLKNFKLPYINKIKQQQIADYLDKKCGEIDKVVETEKLVIEKLKEYKQSIITETVTKGLNKSIPLKDSGIEWIGKIPQHWEIIKLKKTISLIADIDHYMPDTTDTGYSYLMTGDLKDIASKIDFENCKHISDSDYNDLSKKIHPVLDDVIFARYATIGTVCYVDIQKDFLVSYSCLIIRPNSEKLFGKFLYYYLISDTFKIEVSQYINSNTQSNVGLDSLQKVYMVLPNKTEQQQIAEYLDKKCSAIDKAIADKEQVIEKFTEYKKSLIYECVTGKKRVA